MKLFETFVFSLSLSIEFHVVARIFSICITCYLFSHVVLNLKSYSKKRKQNHIMIISWTWLVVVERNEHVRCTVRRDSISNCNGERSGKNDVTIQSSIRLPSLVTRQNL